MKEDHPQSQLSQGPLLAKQFLHCVHQDFLYFRHDNTFHPRMFFPVVLESALYALTMGSLIVLVKVDLLDVDPRLSIGLPAASAVYFAGTRPSIRRTLLSAGLRKPRVHYAGTPNDGIENWRASTRGT